MLTRNDTDTADPAPVPWRKGGPMTGKKVVPSNWRNYTQTVPCHWRATVGVLIMSPCRSGEVSDGSGGVVVDGRWCAGPSAAIFGYARRHVSLMTGVQSCFARRWNVSSAAEPIWEGPPSGAEIRGVQVAEVTL